MVDLNPVQGHEQGGTRPAVIVGSKMHCSFPTAMAIVAPCTTSDRGLPHHVAIDWRRAGLRRQTLVRTDDIRAVSQTRLVGSNPLGAVQPEDLSQIKRFLRIMLDL
jgi:mRNA interferase MazF